MNSITVKIRIEVHMGLAQKLGFLMYTAFSGLLLLLFLMIAMFGVPSMGEEANFLFILPLVMLIVGQIIMRIQFTKYVEISKDFFNSLFECI